jgi:hypothetical protein
MLAVLDARFLVYELEGCPAGEGVTHPLPFVSVAEARYGKSAATPEYSSNPACRRLLPLSALPF